MSLIEKIDRNRLPRHVAIIMDGNGRWASQKELDEAMNRMIRHSEFCERMIAPDGTYPAFGRSVTYRTSLFIIFSFNHNVYTNPPRIPANTI